MAKKSTAIHARRLSERVTILEAVTTSNEFGGSTTSFEPTTPADSRWCMVEDLSTGANAQRSTDIGLTDFTDTLKFTLRYDPLKSISAKINALQFRGDQYTILNVSKMGFTDVKLVLIARKNTQST